MLNALSQSRAALAIVAFCSVFMVGQAQGQFTTVLNIPPDPDIADNQSVASHTQVNLFRGGTIGDSFRAGAVSSENENIEVNISDGSVGDAFQANNRSIVNIAGGSVGESFEARFGSVVFVTGGTMGDDLEVFLGSLVDISGGSVGDGIRVLNGGVVEMRGGSVGEDFAANFGSVINLFGTQFVLNGADITSTLELNVPRRITVRDVTLGGLLEDDSPFSFDLNSTNTSGGDYFDSAAMLSVTLVLPGDFDRDGDVDGADFLDWQRGESPVPLSSANLASWETNYGTAPTRPGDFNHDGEVNGFDFLAWQRGESPDPLSASDLDAWESNYGTVTPLATISTAVPEPTSWIVLLMGTVALPYSRNRARAQLLP